VADPIVGNMHQVGEAHGVKLHRRAGVVGGQALRSCPHSFPA
jgi:hypothetical protein